LGTAGTGKKGGMGSKPQWFGGRRKVKISLCGCFTLVKVTESPKEAGGKMIIDHRESLRKGQPGFTSKKTIPRPGGKKGEENARTDPARRGKKGANREGPL